MKTIESRKDIEELVQAFYDKIKVDALLGPIFNQHIAETAWPDHLENLSDFWETNLFGVARFKGSPTQKHINVDHNLQYSIEQRHFEQWLALWFETIDEQFSGPLAQKAKQAAERMAHGQYLVIWKHRPKSEWDKMSTE